MKVTHIDHIYLSVSNFEQSEKFYDSVMESLGFKKGNDPINGEQHAHYFNKDVQLSIRPARSSTDFNSYAPGLHHLCFQVPTKADVDVAARKLQSIGVEVCEPQEYPEYAKGYYALHFNDPDGIRFEIVARTEIRELISKQWGKLKGFLNPVSRLNE